MVQWDRKLEAHILTLPHAEERLKVIREAWEWQDTPWRNCSRDKGKATDCGNFPAGVFHNAGLIEQPELIYYPYDFWRHSKVELFRDAIEKYCNPLGKVAPLAADLVGFQVPKFGSRFTPSICHIGIFLHGTRMIHARGGAAMQGGVGAMDGMVEFGDLLGPYEKMWSGVWRLKAWC